MGEFRFGMEEEYFVADRRTAGVKSRLAAQFMKKAKKKIGPQLMYELLQSQVEVATTPVDTPKDARQQLRYFRSALAEAGHSFGIGIVAAGTHPLALPGEQRTTRKRRYATAAKDLGMVAWGSPLCGLHVHVEVPAPERRVEVMHRLVPYLPLLLALSTSSPFWAGSNTGLLGYRNAANDAFPRTGFPEMFRSMEEYEAYVQALTDAQVIRDSTFIWWALRPSLRHPTLELRITDCCTAVDDAVAIASLYRALVRYLVRRRGPNEPFCAVTRALTQENRWRAQRYGTDGTYFDLTSRKAIDFDTLLKQTLDETAEDIAALDLQGEMAHVLHIRDRGTSAHLQLRMYKQLRKEGQPHKRALQEMARWLQACSGCGYFLAQSAAPSQQAAA
jgi:carboxylate-amine ligase